MSGAEKEKKSRWRLSGFGHKKDKEEPKEKNEIRKESSANTFDSAYASSEPSSSANPSFTSRPVSGEQYAPPPVPSQSYQQPQVQNNYQQQQGHSYNQGPSTEVTPPTPPADPSRILPSTSSIAFENTCKQHSAEWFCTSPAIPRRHEKHRECLEGDAYG
jgi:hypothetical protein